ncbi:MAG: hypothetical protein RL648_1211 [Verrucomicrobiota bacterium]|jgi:hypothetical protein
MSAVKTEVSCRIPLLVLCCWATLLFSGCRKIDYDIQYPVTGDGAWCWFQDPRAVFIQGKHERTYIQWMTRKGQLQVGAFDHASKETVVHTLKEDWDVDDHNVGAFVVLPDKRLMAFYARHNKGGLFCRTTTQPEDICQWDEEVTVSGTDRVTYAHPVYLSEEKRFYVFWRGPTWKPTFATSEDGKTWSEPQVLIQEEGRDDRKIRPYTKVVSDGKSTIHLAFTDGHPRNEAQNSIYYLRYEAGQFRKADGSLVGDLESLPVQHSKSDRVYDGRSTNVRAWVYDIALDKKGYPVLAYTRLPAESDHRYCFARWTGREWLDVEISPGGPWFPQTPDGEVEREPHYSGGMAFDHSNPFILFLSRRINGSFEIEKWQSRDNGNSWISQAITRDSGELNVRPVVARGFEEGIPHVLWMSGSYEHYTRYSTGIKLSYYGN